MSQSSSAIERPLRLLALDGGGVRGLSSLYLLREILSRVKEEENLTEIPYPCRYFDMICGTSTGGLIAIMLGRLRMSVDEAIDAYVQLSKGIFSKKKWWWKEGMYHATVLKQAIEKIVNERTGNAESMMIDPHQPEAERCKVFVCAVNTSNADAGSMFRTYQVARNALEDCPVWQAARATSAAPHFFKPMVIETGGLEASYIDGGVRYNNPISRLLEEVAEVFPGRQVSCIVSLGTGQKNIINLPKAGFIPMFQLLLIVKLLQKIATDCEEKHEQVYRRLGPVSGLYFRFNVDQGMQGVGLEEWARLGEIRSHTNGYLAKYGPNTSVNAAVASLRGNEPRITTNALAGLQIE